MQEKWQFKKVYILFLINYRDIKCYDLTDKYLLFSCCLYLTFLLPTECFSQPPSLCLNIPADLPQDDLHSLHMIAQLSQLSQMTISITNHWFREGKKSNLFLHP